MVTFITTITGSIALLTFIYEFHKHLAKCYKYCNGLTLTEVKIRRRLNRWKNRDWLIKLER